MIWQKSGENFFNICWCPLILLLLQPDCLDPILFFLGHIMDQIYRDSLYCFCGWKEPILFTHTVHILSIFLSNRKANLLSFWVAPWYHLSVTNIFSYQGLKISLLKKVSKSAVLENRDLRVSFSILSFRRKGLRFDLSWSGYNRELYPFFKKMYVKAKAFHNSIFSFVLSPIPRHLLPLFLSGKIEEL